MVKLHEEIAAFEVAEAKRTADIAKARERASKFREWLLRQGAVLNKDGTVKRDQSHSIVKYDHQLAEQGMTKVRFDAGSNFTGTMLLGNRSIRAKWLLISAARGTRYMY